jgi:hypothetical protein
MLQNINDSSYLKSVIQFETRGKELCAKLIKPIFLLHIYSTIMAVVCPSVRACMRVCVHARV